MPPAAPPQALTLHINGQPVALSVAPGTTLLDVLREDCQLHGTHQGCDTVQCGACTVLVQGRAVKSCNRLALQCQDQAITTIEDVSGPDGGLHAGQLAFSRHHALQCGFCTPGLVMRTLALLHDEVPAEPDAVRAALSGNLCRCTGYEGIVQAVLEVLRSVRPCARETRA